MILVVFSSWYDNRRLFNMLKCVYSGLLTNYTFSKVKSSIEMLHALQDSGNMSPQNLTLLNDTIIITKQFALKDKLGKEMASFPNVEASILSHYRQETISFFSSLTDKELTAINGLYNNPTVPYSDRWSMLFDLEKCRREINEENWYRFVRKLKDIDLKNCQDTATQGTSNYVPGFLRNLIGVYNEIHSPFLPYETMKAVCDLLDRPNSHDKDWHGVAREAGYASYMNYMKDKMNSPTMCAMHGFSKKGLSLEDFKNCMIEMKRNDVVDLIEEYLAKED